jgi:hypothetical protein
LPGFELVTDRITESVPPDVRVTLERSSEDVIPEGLTEDVRVIVPAKWFTLDRVTDVEESVVPKLRVNDALEAEMLKSWTLTITVVEEESAPDVPVIVRVAFPELVPVTFRTAKAVPPGARVRSVGLTPPLTQAKHPVWPKARCTVPEKPPLLVKVILDVPEDPTLTAKVGGLADREKAVRTVTCTVTERVSVPLVPLTVTS